MNTELDPELLTWTARPVPGALDREVMFTDLFVGDSTLHGIVFDRDGETWATVVRGDADGVETNMALAHGPFRRDAAKSWVVDTILLLTAP